MQEGAQVHEDPNNPRAPEDGGRPPVTCQGHVRGPGSFSVYRGHLGHLSLSNDTKHEEAGLWELLILVDLTTL